MTLVIGLCCAEVICHGYLMYPAPRLSSILYMAAGLSMVLLCLSSRTRTQSTPPQKSMHWIYYWAAIAGLSIMLCTHMAEAFVDVPIDYHIADMLPVIEQMNSRFISGDDPYAIIPDIWGGMQPVYLPAMWLPYCLPTLLDIDIRWIGVVALLAGLFGSYGAAMSRLSTDRLVVMTIPALLLLLSFVSSDHMLLSLSEEGIVTGYYLLLAYMLYREHIIGIAIAVSLCLMSRYALLPWALVLGFLIGYVYGFRRMVIYGSIVIGLSGILMIITGAHSHLEVFVSLSDRYMDSVSSLPQKYQPLINHSLGIAKFWPYEKLSALHMIMQTLSILTPVAMGVYYIRRRPDLPFGLYALISLKLCLVLFYNLLIMPYGYLFYTSTILSIALLCYYYLYPYERATTR